MTTTPLYFLVFPIPPSSIRARILASEQYKYNAAIKPNAIAVATEGAKGEG